MSGPAIVLASGGLDSCVTTALAARTGAPVHLLHVNYGQRTEHRELQCFNAIADRFSIPESRRLVVDIGYLKQIGSSALTDASIAVPEREPLDRHGVPVTYVPQRNGNLLFIAAAWAEAVEAGEIWTGMVEEDSSGYPDCRRPFAEAIQHAIGLGNHDDHDDPEVRTPLISMTKAEIIRTGLEVSAPLELTWSCYQREDIACGVCDSCRLRLRGFERAGVTDPIAYARR